MLTSSTLQRQILQLYAKQDLVRMWKEAVMDYFEIPSYYLSQGLKKLVRTLNQYNWSQDQVWNPSSPKYER
jgi:Mor family transcriptional regulator